VPTSTPAHVTPEVLRWARESIGYDLEDAAKRIDVAPEKLARAEEGTELLTLRQAEKAAAAYDRPLAALFLPGTPEEESIEGQFRRLADAPPPPWPPELIMATREVRERQDAAADLYEMLDEAPNWPRFEDFARRVGADVLPQVVRHELPISLEDQQQGRDPKGYTPLRHWIDAVERVGVLVMQIGDAPLNIMRGFASPHDSVPAIVVNTEDDARARAFTVIHELGHLLLLARGEHEGSKAYLEEWCENFAGEVIMPTETFHRTVNMAAGGGDLLATVDEVALTLGVTPRAAAVRARRLGIISSAELAGIIRRLEARPIPAPPRGGNYYYTRIGRLGPSFVRLVLAALDSQALTYPRASGLLGVKVNHFATLRDYMDRRPALQ
jgi:Zn-dependent peptidase ImmA (M78 family)